MTGGGGNMAMKASSIAPNFWLSCIASAPPLSSGLSRSSNGFSVTNTMPALELLVKPAIERPGKATALSTPGLLQGDVAHAPDHVLGAVEGRAVGELGEADEVLLVLGRHEAVGDRPEHADGDAEQDEVEAHHQRLAREHAPHAPAVGPRAVPEDEVEPAEQPAERPVHRAREGVLGLAASLEQQGRQRRRQRQRIDRRDHRRDGDGQRELVVEPAGQAADEGERHEHRDEHRAMAMIGPETSRIAR